MLSQWNELNDTERYFNLLEAWLRSGHPEMIGEQPTTWSSMALPCLQGLRPLLATGANFEVGNSPEVCLTLISRELYQLAVMDLFGLVEVQRPSRPVGPWCPAGVKRVPFGDALASVLMPSVSDRLLAVSPAISTRSMTNRGRHAHTSVHGKRYCSPTSPNGTRT